MMDTLSMAADLAAAGIDKKHAEAQARVIASAVEKQYDEVATKDFVRSEISAVRSEISAVRSEISAAKFAITCWVVGTGIALAALSVTVLGLWIG